MEDYILEMKNIVRTFPGVRALNGVDFRARRGSVHALMGENGAGKSTLMKCLVGINPPDSGEIRLKGEKVTISNPHDALKLGIAMIYQELNPVIERSVMENIWLGREPMLRGCSFLVDHRAMYEQTRLLLEELEIDIDPKIKVKELSVAKMQMIEIAKAISYNADIVIMDEPTSSLTPNEVEHLFSMIRKLKDRNVAIIYITHKMEEIFTIADEVTVLRDGNHITTKPIAEMTIDSLITAMVGRRLTEMFPKMESQIGDVKLAVRHLEVPGLLHDIPFLSREKGNPRRRQGLWEPGARNSWKRCSGYVAEAAAKFSSTAKGRHSYALRRDQGWNRFSDRGSQVERHHPCTLRKNEHHSSQS